MLKLRLKRFGKKKEPSYRIVAADSRARNQGRTIQELGFYNPRTKEIRLDAAGIVSFLKQGAQPTKTLDSLLARSGVYRHLEENKTKLDLRSLESNLQLDLHSEEKFEEGSIVNLRVNLKFPSKVDLSETLDLKLCLDRDTSTSDWEEPLLINVLLEVDEQIFTIKDTSIRTAIVPAQGKSEWLGFPLTPRQMGKGEISIRLFQDTAYIGNWELEATVWQETGEEKRNKPSLSRVNLKSVQT